MSWRFQSRSASRCAAVSAPDRVERDDDRADQRGQDDPRAERRPGRRDRRGLAATARRRSVRAPPARPGRAPWLARYPAIRPPIAPSVRTGPRPQTLQPTITATLPAETIKFGSHVLPSCASTLLMILSIPPWATPRPVTSTINPDSSAGQHPRASGAGNARAPIRCRPTSAAARPPSAIPPTPGRNDRSGHVAALRRRDGKQARSDTAKTADLQKCRNRDAEHRHLDEVLGLADREVRRARDGKRKRPKRSIPRRHGCAERSISVAAGGFSSVP